MADSFLKKSGRNLPAAVAVAVVLLAVLVLTLKFWHWGFVLLAVAMLVAAAFELSEVFRKAGYRIAIIPVVLGIVAVLTAPYAVASSAVSNIGWQSVLSICLALTVLAVLIFRLPEGADGYLKDSAANLFLIGYLAILAAFIPLMLVGVNGAARVAAYLLCVVASDTGGYAIGIWLGRHPLAPAISPKKTWEGLFGSAVFALVVGCIMAVYFLQVSWWIGIILGVTCVIFGTLGDLIESMIKRDLGIKDMSSALPGHGGVTDRIDAMLIAAPPAWLVLVLLVPGG